MASPAIQCQLWMGCVEPYMTESFIMTAFQKMGEKPVVIKVMRNKFTGEPAGYCFVHFSNDDEAVSAMYKLNGKLIPNTTPAARFRLNLAAGGKLMLLVNDLASDVDDYTLYKAFASRYPAIKTAKVVLDNTGFSKGYGFIRFGNEEEYKHCLNHMNGFKGLSSKPIKVSNPETKTNRSCISYGLLGGYSSSGHDFGPFSYEQIYWQNYSAWNNSSEDPVHCSYFYDIPTHTILDTAIISKEDELELIEHESKLDIDNWNREMIHRDYNLWDALEFSKWSPLEPLDDPAQNTSIARSSTRFTD